MMSKNDSLLFWIKVIVFLDFFGVALVVPLLTSYFRDAGISTKLLGFLSSLYSISQIFGGVVIGVMSDSQSKRDVLLLSLLGSAASYFIVGTTKSIGMLFFSRILVGLVKQTYTIATTVINEVTDGLPDLRSQELGRLSAISTVSFIVGPSLGSILYQHSRGAPAKAAALCFVLNSIICIVFIPRTGIMSARTQKIQDEIVEVTEEKSMSFFSRVFLQPFNLFKNQLSELASIPNVLVVIVIRIAIMFVESSMSSRNIVNYYETRFGIPTSALGFMSTATSGCFPLFSSITSLTGTLLFSSRFAYDTLTLRFASFFVISVIGMVIQTLLLNPLLKLFGGNTSMIYFALAAISLCSLLEGLAPSYLFFVVCSQVPNVIASSLLAASLRNIFANTIPSQHIGKSTGNFFLKYFSYLLWLLNGIR